MSKHKRGGELSSTLAKNKRLEPTNHDWIWWVKPTMPTAVQICDHQRRARARLCLRSYSSPPDKGITTYQELSWNLRGKLFGGHYGKDTFHHQVNSAFIGVPLSKHRPHNLLGTPHSSPLLWPKSKRNPQNDQTITCNPKQHSIVVVYVHFICQHLPTKIPKPVGLNSRLYIECPGVTWPDASRSPPPQKWSRIAHRPNPWASRLKPRTFIPNIRKSWLSF